MSTTFSNTVTFNRSHARRVATKMAADLYRMQHTYGWPTDTVIGNLIEEVTELLANDYMKSVEIGFARNGQRVVSLKYYARTDGTLTTDDNAGGIPRGVDISGCDRINYVVYGSKWFDLTEQQRRDFPHQRVGAPEPSDGMGYWIHDRTYSSGGGGTERKTFRPL